MPAPIETPTTLSALQARKRLRETLSPSAGIEVPARPVAETVPELADSGAKKKGEEAAIVPGSPSFPDPGVYYDLDPAIYQSARLDRKKPLMGQPVSKSLLHSFQASPWAWHKAERKKESAAFRWGHMIDCLLLTPLRWGMDYAVVPEELMTKSGISKGKKAIEWVEEQHPKTVISPAENTEAIAAVSRIIDHAYAVETMRGGRTQVAMIHHEPVKNWGVPLPITGLIDIVPDREGEWGEYLVDLKTCRALSERKLAYDFRDFGYDMQAGLYLWLWNKLNPEEPRHKFAFIVQESSPPYEVGVVTLPQEDIAKGLEKAGEALQTWIRCVSLDSFPSPWEEPRELRLP